MKILSTGVNSQYSAGIYEPIYANIAAIQVYLIKVDFPPIFGPVINRMLGPS